ncbi:MAG TPA: response regulator [Gemmatimonadaceae bacterium]
MTIPAATVLIIEDNEDNCVIMSAWLEHAGYRVVVANDGLYGVTLARSIIPNVILMDVELPVMDGWTAARTLREDATTKHIPIIALTAMALPQDAERARDAGVALYLAKPVSLARVLKSVQQVL